MLGQPDRQTIRVALLGFAAVVVLLAFPRNEIGMTGLVAVVGWVTFATILVGWLLRANAVPTATIVAAIMLAYTQGIGDAAEDGLRYGGFHPTGESVTWAMLGVGVFLGTAAVVSRLVASFAERRAKPRKATSSMPDEVLLKALLFFLFATFIAALATGLWSFWGDRSVATEESGGFVKLELFYAPTLVVTAWFGTLARRDETASLGLGGSKRRLGWRVWAIAGAIGLMLFALQSRRLMVVVGLMLVFVLITTTDRREIRTMVARAFAMAGLLFVFSTASAGWRDLSTESRVSVAERFEGAIDAVGDTRAFEQIESRLTYLWFDAAAHQLSDMGTDLSMSELALSNFARAVPRVLFPGKDEIEPVACENYLEGLSLPDDLPCTPSGEGALWAGFLGIMFAGLIAGLNLGTAEVLVRRGGLARIVGLYLLIPYAMLETGVFGFIAGIRLGLIGTGFVWIVAIGIRLLGAGRASGRRRDAHASSPLR
jgi:hypothetical protein